MTNGPMKTVTVNRTSLAALTGPPGPIEEPADCLGYGRDLPPSWGCPECPLAAQCFELLEARKFNGGSNGQGR